MKTKPKSSRKPRAFNPWDCKAKANAGQAKPKSDEPSLLRALRTTLQAAVDPICNGPEWLVDALREGIRSLEQGGSEHVVNQKLMTVLYERWRDAHAINERLETELRAQPCFDRSRFDTIHRDLISIVAWLNEQHMGASSHALSTLRMSIQHQIAEIEQLRKPKGPDANPELVRGMGNIAGDFANVAARKLAEEVGRDIADAIAKDADAEVLHNTIPPPPGEAYEIKSRPTVAETVARNLKEVQDEIANRLYSWRQVSDGEWHVFTPYGDSIGAFKDQSAAMTVCVACNNGRIKPCHSPKQSSTGSNNTHSVRSARSKAR